MAALRDLIARHPKTDRSAFKMYTTAEPCPMCAAAIVWCDFGDVVYGIRRPELVRLGWDDFSMRAQELLEDARTMGRYADKLSVFGPALRARCVDLFEGHRSRRAGVGA
jgi:tRNA(Arg) A34 adenosine deaminase TadA